MSRTFVVTICVLKVGAIGDRQEFMGVSTLDLLILCTHPKTGAIGDNNDFTGTLSFTLMLESLLLLKAQWKAGTQGDKLELLEILISKLLGVKR